MNDKRQENERGLTPKEANSYLETPDFLLRHKETTLDERLRRERWHETMKQRKPFPDFR